MSLATNSWTKNRMAVGSPSLAQHPIFAGAREEMALGSTSCPGAGGWASRVNPALTNVSVEKLSSRAGAEAAFRLPWGREARLNCFMLNTGFLSRQPPSQRTPWLASRNTTSSPPTQQQHPTIWGHGGPGMGSSPTGLMVTSLWSVVSSPTGGIK